MANVDKVLKEMRENAIKKEQETKEINEKILQVPENLSNVEKNAYKEITIA